ncbi:hypothetical protein PPUJ13061_22240 [Pseudomonas putida]|nr:hypothetical protein PPUJ13061_22240 [Pseudomonas putida]
MRLVPRVECRGQLPRGHGGAGVAEFTDRVVGVLIRGQGLPVGAESPSQGDYALSERMFERGLNRYKYNDLGRVNFGCKTFLKLDRAAL